MTAAGRGDRLQSRGIAAVAFVVDQRPRPRQRRRSEIGGIPAHRIAGGVADAAIDAFDRRIGGDARRGLGPDLRDGVVPRPRRRKDALGALPLGEKVRHVGDQILDHRQVFQRPDFEPAVASHLRDMGAAGPARLAVDGHGAGAADADPAGEAIGQRRIEMALHEGHDVEHGLAFAPRHGIGLVTACSRTAPDRDREFRKRVRHKSPWSVLYCAYFAEFSKRGCAQKADRARRFRRIGERSLPQRQRAIIAFKPMGGMQWPGSRSATCTAPARSR